MIKGQALPRHRLTLGALGVLVLAIALVFALTGRGGSHLSSARAGFLPPIGTSMSVLRQRFAVLGQRHSNECALRPRSIPSLAVNGRLQGACCTAMDFGHYVDQVRGLVRYRALAQVPVDPYDIPVSQARQLIGYARSISLTPGQQTIYKQAKTLSREHGPCCCHCWRWTAFEGQANYLITRLRYSAARIANVWDLENGCGGA